MAQAITRLFDRHEQAAEAVRQLEAAGVAPDDISLIANNVEGRHLSEGRRDEVDGNDAGDGAAKGATTGGLIGGGAGLLAGLGMLAIPGLGPVVAAGWLVSTAVGAAVGAAAGGAAGGLLGALKDAGHSDEDAQVYAEGVRRGGTLVSVRPSGEAEQAAAERILRDRGGVEAAVRGAAYRDAGWRGFDPAGQPYSADDLVSDRARYGEDRSFAGSGDPTPTDPAEPSLDRPRPADPTLRTDL